MRNTANFIQDLKSTIISRLNDYSGCSYYGCDLAYTLFEGENANGSVLCNTYQTTEFIKDNFDLFGQLVNYCNDSMDTLLNPFNDPEKAHVILLLESANSLLSQLPTIDENWNNKIKLTDAMIEQLTTEINNLKITEEELF
jgi:uncharacterized protein YjbI with pentapeptide repeats